MIRLLLLALLPASLALKFEIQAHPGAESSGKERCIRNFVAKDQLVVVTATVSGNRGDGQMLNMHVRALQTSPFPPRFLSWHHWLLKGGTHGKRERENERGKKKGTETDTWVT